MCVSVCVVVCVYVNERMNEAIVNWFVLVTFVRKMFQPATRGFPLLWTCLYGRLNTLSSR